MALPNRVEREEDTKVLRAIVKHNQLPVPFLDEEMLPRATLTTRCELSSRLGKENLSMQMYHFVTEWAFDFPIQTIWQELNDFQSFPIWWQDWKKIDLRGDDPIPRVGSIFDCEVKGSLPYSLRYSLEITRSEPPFLNEHKATGDLIGRGKWVLKETDTGTVVQHHWHVGTSNIVLNCLAYLPFVKRMLEQNHAAVMARGSQGLKNRLEQKARGANCVD